MVAVDVVAIADRQIVLVDQPVHQRRRRGFRILRIGRRDDRDGNVIVERDRQRAGVGVAVAVVRREADRRGRVVLRVRAVVDLEDVVLQVDRIGPVGIQRDGEQIQPGAVTSRHFGRQHVACNVIRHLLLADGDDLAVHVG